MNGLGQLAGLLPMLMQQGKIGDAGMGAGMGLLPMLMQKGQGQQGFNPMAMMQMFGQQQDQQPMAPPPMMPRSASGQSQPPMGMSSLPTGGMTPPFNPAAQGSMGGAQGFMGGMNPQMMEQLRMMMMRGMR